ncbi:MAG: ribonuclease HII [Anaerolineales bacterium]|jgi:ribonuclease HII
MPRKKFDLSTLPPVPDLQFEQALWGAGIVRIAGVDEAGRGALAGPVAAGVVVLPQSDRLLTVLEGVRDSKQMSAKQRLAVIASIEAAALACQVGFASPAEVDELGILPATRQAALRALEQLPEPAEHLLVDHITLHAQGIPETPLTKGDRRSLSIAAASILAKVGRDEIMLEMDAQYPEYGFASHKGYGTTRHLAAIESLGPCPIHRMTFSPIRQDPEQMDLL